MNKFSLSVASCLKLAVIASSRLRRRRRRSKFLSVPFPVSLDLVLCDLLMPQMDGNELVRRAKQLHPGLPAMIVSGTVNAFDRALHADVFLPKGACSPAEMIERIRVLVARKRGPKKVIPAASTQSADLGTFAHATAS